MVVFHFLLQGIFPTPGWNPHSAVKGKFFTVSSGKPRLEKSHCENEMVSASKYVTVLSVVQSWNGVRISNVVFPGSLGSCESQFELQHLSSAHGGCCCGESIGWALQERPQCSGVSVPHLA